ncbi:glycosyltransferase [Salinispirillum marinum]|uniref:Glycosyltransferase n=2 Tax=Saccharospirillaceae TaxID=255527 RepID=A0ABV8BFW3_9GAMM
MLGQSTTSANKISAQQERKLLIICPTDTWGGVEKNVRLRAAAMAQRGHSVTVLLCENTFEARFKDLPNVHLETMPYRPSNLSPSLYWSFYRKIKKIQPDCVFVPLKKDWWAATLAGYLAKVPQRILYLGIKRRIKENLKYRLLFKSLKALLIVNSKDLRTHLKSSNRYLHDGNLKLIYNGFELPELGAALGGLRSSLGIPLDAPVVGCAGRFSHQKGFDLLPEILHQLPENAHLIIAGGGDLEDQLCRQFNDTVGSERIHLIGPQNDMSMFFQTLDIFLLPSRNEGMANVLNEALSYGLPAVSTHVPGSAELLEADPDTPDDLLDSPGIWRGKHGLITRVNDTEALARALNLLISGKVKFDPEQQRGKIRRDHDLTIMMNLTEQIFFNQTFDEKPTTPRQKAAS